MSFRERLRRSSPFHRNGTRESLQLLPVIRTQLAETSRHIEESVVGVCSHFTAIATRARAAVTQSAQLLDGDSGGSDASVESSIERSRQTIAQLLDRMERAAKLSALAVNNMDDVSKTVTDIEDLLGQVHRIAFTNKVIALNAKIEAVHVGELGSGFEVVADEISRQAGRSGELAEGIAVRIKDMRSRVDAAAGDLRDFLNEDRAKLAQSRQDAEGALGMLWSLHQRTRASLERTAKEQAQLADEIASAVIGLQFQDRVKQRVEHVIEAIETLEQVFRGTAGASGNALSGDDLLGNVHASYTMESERAAHHRAAVPGSSEPPEPEMQVELF